MNSSYISGSLHAGGSVTSENHRSRFKKGANATQTSIPSNSVTGGSAIGVTAPTSTVTI